MIKLFTTVLLALLFLTANGQPLDTSRIDNNPRLTSAESEWLNARYGSDTFDFRDKYIGFGEATPGPFWGIGRITWRLTKKSFFQRDPDKYLHRLFILDSAGRKITRGYDAVLVIGLKKHKGKLRRLTLSQALFYARNRYPQLPADAGADSNALLSPANAVFFNELYKADIYPHAPFDFTGKKVAIFNTHCDADKVQRVSIPAYVARIRQQLDTDGYSVSDHTYYLTEAQQRASGGYDVIIQYQCKKDLPLDYLISLLQ